MLLRLALPLCALIATVACSPALNWREVDGVAGQRWWFPCKPERIDRQVMLQGQPVPARLAACDAQGASWSNLAMQFPSPAEAAAALAGARTSLMANLGAEERGPPPGVALQAPQGPLWLSGHRSGGEAVTAAARFQVQDRWLVQQVLIAPAAGAWPRVLDDGALQTFFDGSFPQR